MYFYSGGDTRNAGTYILYFFLGGVSIAFFGKVLHSVLHSVLHKLSTGKKRVFKAEARFSFSVKCYFVVFYKTIFFPQASITLFFWHFVHIPPALTTSIFRQSMQTGLSLSIFFIFFILFVGNKSLKVISGGNIIFLLCKATGWSVASVEYQPAPRIIFTIKSTIWNEKSVNSAVKTIKHRERIRAIGAINPKPENTAIIVVCKLVKLACSASIVKPPTEDGKIAKIVCWKIKSRV